MLRTVVRMSSEVSAKRLKPTPPLIGTHNGHFHADEALAVYLLRLLPTYQPSSLVRTRDPAVLETCHTVVDVGGEYDATKLRFDHHQRTFNTTFPARHTKLSSAGLVYMHFGKAIISRRTGFAEDSSEAELIYQKLYADFIEALDANDNGISAYAPDAVKGISKRFNDSGVTLGSLVSDLNHEYPDFSNPAPSTTSSSTSNQNSEDPDSGSTTVVSPEDARFLQASQLMGTVFLRKLYSASTAWLPAREIVRKARNERSQVHPSGAIMVLPKPGVPWKDHLYTLEDESPSSPESLPKVLYVLYPEAEITEPAGPQPKWRVQCVSVSKDSFENRRGLKEEWRGLRDDELSRTSGIEGCVFVHASGFVGGNGTFEGARRMAVESMA
jgi:uncharacterized UPF0160 family protein